jgi:hypothetical protein
MMRREHFHNGVLHQVENLNRKIIRKAKTLLIKPNLKIRKAIFSILYFRSSTLL